MTALPIRLLIVDDHPLVREGIRQALSVAGFEVLADVGSAEEGLAVLRTATAAVVVMDITLPGMSGIEATERIRRDHPTVRVLVLSVHDHPEYVLESVRAGASGYLRKDSLPDELRDAVREVSAGRTVFPPSKAGATEVAAPILTAAAQRLDRLTRREREVLIGIASGRTNREIAVGLALSVRTVESYRETLMGKLGIRSAAGLTRFAIEAKLL
ncbi:MAG: response regulator transcription factor [Gemmatimonadota bacterium]|nr:response regulator transcription factor [Gemmatimonadota bacterium]MDQ8178758.1 response regulator transcription factor [Gemmatimonadota bacterium]